MYPNSKRKMKHEKLNNTFQKCNFVLQQFLILRPLLSARHLRVTYISSLGSNFGKTDISIISNLCCWFWLKQNWKRFLFRTHFWLPKHKNHQISKAMLLCWLVLVHLLLTAASFTDSCVHFGLGKWAPQFCFNCSNAFFSTIKFQEEIWREWCHQLFVVCTRIFCEGGKFEETCYAARYLGFREPRHWNWFGEGWLHLGFVQSLKLILLKQDGKYARSALILLWKTNFNFMKVNSETIFKNSLSSVYHSFTAVCPNPH